MRQEGVDMHAAVQCGAVQGRAGVQQYRWSRQQQQWRTSAAATNARSVGPTGPPVFTSVK
jgi:hypothetical protein